MVAYLLIGVAVVAEVFGDSMMKLSNGFERKLPLLGTVAGYGLAFYLVSLALEHLPLGPVYAAWTGLGIALTAVVATVVWKEKFDLKKAVGLAAIIVGVVMLKMGV
ncbi:MAG: SMR family transporter [Slackia sp.]|nr:SMR family transporter [Slackia sp.]